ncbi:M16 family metallopeptidase [Janthinobacterium agaricidamnosum]|uniref:Putative zinc protease n=1 Tax=Janthinobacterium agaricidamnosum NBRC 102515 = DSM 9628 TaxID=1349767 RepID=W0VA51_9BURK|nr:pitrilysin family protein [Janthinobacterium agaricidamnosum]CDG84771.1 putative zinc protease [Janthinobacterium agaricidamnosum NBRC 102515 = DSM 9628]
MTSLYWKQAGLLLCAFTFVGPGIAAGQTLPAGIVKGPSVEGITEYRLPNGLTVLLFPDASKPSVTVNVTYLVGSRHENYGETGMAHLLEHMMFKGAPKNRSIPQQFANRGMEFNGSTTDDRTNYYEVFQAGGDNLKWALDMEADRMVHSFIDKKDLDSEMTVVRNEYESGENSPFSVLLKRMQSVAYDWHSYGRATIGNRSDIENVKIDNLRAFYRTYYQPDNAVLLVAGKFDPAQTLKWISQGFGAIPKPKRVLPPFWTVEPTQDGERGFTVRRQGDIQVVALAYKVPAALHPDSDRLGFMSEILGSGASARLHKALVESGKAVDVFSFSQAGYAPGLQIIGAVVKKGDPLAPVQDALIDAVENFYKTPPTPEEMARVRMNYANEIDKSLNNPQSVGVALSEQIALGDWRLLFQGRDELPNISSEQVSQAAARYFRRDNRTIGIFLPDDAPQRAEIPAAPAVADVMKDFKGKAATLAGEDFDPSQANILARTEVSAIGGLKVALLPKKSRGQEVSVDLRLHWGDEHNLFGKNAIQSLTDAMLTRGTSKYSREQLQDASDKLKISGSLYHFTTTRDNLDAALRLVAHVLREPSFPAGEFEQLRQQWIVGLEANRNDPQDVAMRAMDEYFNRYPKGDVRAVATYDEQVAQAQAATLDDVKAFHRDFYGASQGELAIVGDFDPAAVGKTIADSFGGWDSKAHYARVDNSNFDVAPLHKNIDTPDKENGVLMARLNLDLRSDDADYPALELANYIFGDGGLKSRLMDRIRQKDGLSYGGGSSLSVSDTDRAGNVTISAIAAPQNLKKLETALREELARALKDGFTAAEVAGAKSGILQQRLQNRAQDNVLAGGWSGFLYLDRTFAWSKQYEDQLQALTVADVNAAFRKAIDPAKLSIVIAGDQSKATAAAAGDKSRR